MVVPLVQIMQKLERYKSNSFIENSHGNLSGLKNHSSVAVHSLMTRSILWNHSTELITVTAPYRLVKNRREIRWVSSLTLWMVRTYEILWHSLWFVKLEPCG